MKRIRAAKYAALRKLVLKIHARAPRLARYHLQGLVMIDWRKGGFVHAGLLLGSPCVRMLVEENRASFPPSWRGDTSPQPCFADALWLPNGGISDCRAEDEDAAIVVVVVVGTTRNGHFYSAASRDPQEVGNLDGDNVRQH
ncbi:hypothetical protein TEQG_07973 [Trichophyton equinum CBS 127.97]|uniref:Uncharacterized protein n=1 Tax=Trichophyton equinum (strain ATCC MYA-4606 / CBS 127.97) TaxID=559882 RepID=F2Q4B1_TRIEC|nr:hypothetical protein TEQG_07973 [Trichophyton equinum CBS 127.97]